MVCANPGRPREVFLRSKPGDPNAVDAGVELIGYILHHTNGRPAPDGSFLRVWQMPEQGLVQLIEETLETAGWHEFFEPGTARGEILTPQVAIPYLVSS